MVRARDSIFPEQSSEISSERSAFSEAETRNAEDWLRLAMFASTRQERIEFADRGLALDSGSLEPDTVCLLLRQKYSAHLEMMEFAEARDLALRIVELRRHELANSDRTKMLEVAHHDASRAYAALASSISKEWNKKYGQEAIDHERMALRNSVPERRSFHSFSLAVLLQYQGDHEAALEQLERGVRWARKDKPLLLALAALIRLENGLAQPRLGAIVASLSASPAREGYGRYLLGMIAYRMGDARQALVHLRAFLRRHASSAPAQLSTLRFEIQQAKAIVSKFESE